MDAFLFRHALELVRLLQDVAQSSREGPFTRHALCFTVELPEPRLLGSSAARLWAGPPDGSTLRGMDAREFLAAQKEPPRLKLDGPVWAFEEWASGPLRNRHKPLGPGDLAAARQLLDGALATLAQRREEEARRVAALHNPAAWEACELCGVTPLREHLLEIVGAPHFGDSCGARDWCVKHCVLCHTCYLFQGGYEYLVNGATEDESTLTRLDAAQAEQWLDRVGERLAERGVTDNWRPRPPGTR